MTGFIVGLVLGIIAGAGGLACYCLVAAEKDGEI